MVSTKKSIHLSHTVNWGKGNAVIQTEDSSRNWSSLTMCTVLEPFLLSPNKKTCTSIVTVFIQQCVDIGKQSKAR